MVCKISYNVDTDPRMKERKNKILDYGAVGLTAHIDDRIIYL